jgi:hypothetical protein
MRFEPRLHRAHYPLGVPDGRIGLLQRDIHGCIVCLVSALEERSEEPTGLLVELATTNQEAEERGNDPECLERVSPSASIAASAAKNAAK